MELAIANRQKPCPHCQSGLSPFAVGLSVVYKCPNCEGLWVGPETFVRILRDPARRIEVTQEFASSPGTRGIMDTEWRYRRCPVCGEMMARINFADISGVIVDVCPLHGVWCDPDELRQIVEFVESDGLGRARKIRSETEAERARSDALCSAIRAIFSQWTSPEC